MADAEPEAAAAEPEAEPEAETEPTAAAEPEQPAAAATGEPNSVEEPEGAGAGPPDGYAPSPATLGALDSGLHGGPADAINRVVRAAFATAGLPEVFVPPPLSDSDTVEIADVRHPMRMPVPHSCLLCLRLPAARCSLLPAPHRCATGVLSGLCHPFCTVRLRLRLQLTARAHAAADLSLPAD